MRRLGKTNCKKKDDFKKLCKKHFTAKFDFVVFYIGDRAGTLWTRLLQHDVFFFKFQTCTYGPCFVLVIISSNHVKVLFWNVFSRLLSVLFCNENTMNADEFICTVYVNSLTKLLFKCLSCRNSAVIRFSTISYIFFLLKYIKLISLHLLHGDFDRWDICRKQKEME